MTIRAVFRVQCDGPCKGWLSVPPELIGKDITHDQLTVEPTAVHAGNWPGERAARVAAVNSGWDYRPKESVHGGQLWCRSCRINPLGIKLPPVCADPEIGHRLTVAGVCVFCDRSIADEPPAQCTSVSPDALGRLRCMLVGERHEGEHVNGRTDWF